MKNVWIAAVLVTLAGVAPARADVEPQQSRRLERAKDYIAGEQWERAIEDLKAAAADAKERNRDEALFWLAHSQHQARDLAAAVTTIATLEAQFPGSRWVKPARSLKIEIAQRLRRTDVLWLTAQPAPPPAPPPAPGPAAPVAATPAPPGPPARPSTAATAPPPMPTPRAPLPPRAVTPSPSRPSTLWIPEIWEPDTNLRIQALGSLIQTDAPRVIPILRDIALQSADASEASRAVFVLAQSGRPDAHLTVLDVARRGGESVQIAAVKELGRFGGADVSEQLLQVYRSGNPRVKHQIVSSLGERAATSALMRIVETESDRRLQESAIVRLGQAGAREQLRRFYSRARPELKRPIIDGLFNARADVELIGIAEQERDEGIRNMAMMRLRLLGTAEARTFLDGERKKEKAPRK